MLKVVGVDANRLSPVGWNELNVTTSIDQNASRKLTQTRTETVAENQMRRIQICWILRGSAGSDENQYSLLFEDEMKAGGWVDGRFYLAW